MPEYNPALQLPTGLVEQIVQMRAQSNNPWAALAENLGNDVSKGVQNYKTRQANQNLTPAQLAALGIVSKAPQGTPVQPSNGAPPVTIGQAQPIGQAFPKGMTPSLAEQILQRQTQADAAAGRSQATLGAAGIRADADAAKRAPIPVNSIHRENYKKVYGHDIPFSEITPQQEKELADAAKAKDTQTGKNNSPAARAKGEQYADKRVTAFSDALDPSKQRAGAFGVSKQAYDRAERLQSLAAAYPDNNLDKRQIEELAIGMNAMLSGANSGAQEQVKSLVPSSIMGNAEKFKEWFTNDPTGTNQQEFVKRMLGSIDREKSTASDQIKRTQLQRTAGYEDLEKSNPDAFYSVLQSRGIQKEEYDAWKKGGRKSASAVQSADGKTSAADYVKSLGL